MLIKKLSTKNLEENTRLLYFVRQDDSSSMQENIDSASAGLEKAMLDDLMMATNSDLSKYEAIVNSLDSKPGEFEDLFTENWTPNVSTEPRALEDLLNKIDLLISERNQTKRQLEALRKESLPEELS
ncbi:hypothetical protein HOH51_02765 [bacterium]|jgi:hypothetical protein|nr:hypothetical protein [bacterium]